MEVDHSSFCGKPGLSNFIRSDFWFQDGNIVLIAGSAAFKVHRGQLERHSDVFRDLFSVPQPAVQNLVDGCPCVEIYDCPSIIYWWHFTMDCEYFQQKPTVTDFPAIAAVLRLSTKYFIEHLRRRCIARLELDWPSTLVGWERRERDAIDAQGRYSPRESCAHPILVINLALELGLDAMLPSAFYDLSRYGPSKILVGTRVPPPVVPLPSGPGHSSNYVPADSQTIHLSQENLCRVFFGREQAQRYIATFIDTELRERNVSLGCLNAGRFDSQYCYESFYFIQLNILRSVGGIACGRDADPLYTLVQAIEMLSRTDFSDGFKQCGLKMCSSCKIDFAIAVRKARGEVWMKIPEWFGLVDVPVGSTTQS
ncbi:hypothetical protein SERLADRAFT_371485 [Serpula lacrymans var. lacrymans S7.9]|uniref:BTB domain-containing protein n=1 Tax=Serpula lacrymans var. lacrymans (strain S7.9) TaxID=578457 RepID=F8P281_SERL9|nr:uncharacterized protein SERLADRAFT_371485 [Serpula lacrymans var. lacrymans S7.9]EGO23259.1 hypothetical protein SERLADRAFT_371485 [Serpula lacrymans var. lacrymans S7.9]